MRARAFVLAAVLLVGGACAGGSGLQGVSGDKTPADAPAAVTAQIPPPAGVPGAVATEVPPGMPERGPGMPTDTVSLEELHRQGQTDVVR